MNDVQRLKKLRLKHCLTQVDMASMLSVNRATYNRWERTRHVPLPVFRMKIAEAITQLTQK